MHRAWSLEVCPKLEYYYFLQKVRRMATERKGGVPDYLSKLRRHYIGEEIMDELAPK